MDKVCLIKQPAGIGDILFCQKIAKHIQTTTDYKKIIWPVAQQYHYLNDYLSDYNIGYPVIDSNFPYKDQYNLANLSTIVENDVMVVPLSTSDSCIRACTCHNNSRAHGHIKYNFSNIDHKDWLNYLSFKRNISRELRLAQQLGVDLNRE